MNKLRAKLLKEYNPMKKWEEYKFKIAAYTPDTLPMSRCASYLTELAEILGEEHAVHFVKVAPGSAQLVHRVEIESVPKVKQSIVAVSRGEGTPSAMRSYRQINKMLWEDNGTAVLAKGRAKILEFPGKEEAKSKFTSIQQQGEIDGEVIRVGGSKDIVPILLDVEGREISGCHAKRAVAKALGRYLFEPVRLFGEGRWDRGVDGEWNLVSFVVDRFDVLQESNLSKTVIALRGIRGNWGDDSIRDIITSRYDEDN